jgi:hypothetical protein
MSKNAYETIRIIWNIPLPNRRTLRYWAAHYKCQPGLLTEIISIIKEEGKAQHLKRL